MDIYPSDSLWGFFLISPILDDENITECQKLPPKSEHFTPKLMSFFWQG